MNGGVGFVSFVLESCGDAAGGAGNSDVLGRARIRRWAAQNFAPRLEEMRNEIGETRSEVSGGEALTSLRDRRKTAAALDELRREIRTAWRRTMRGERRAKEGRSAGVL